MKYRLRSINTFSIVRFGCLLGWIVTVIPSLTCGLVAWRMTAALQTWMEGWKHIDLSLMGFDYTLNLIDILQLRGLLEALQTIEVRSLPLMIGLVVVAAILGGVLITFTLLLLSWGYNLVAWLTGGVVLELQEPADHPAQGQ
ncbi:MAG: hypothetical protein P8186_19015 [Anaerolineae bacterium]